jgi:CheY-like chemotaxis protein
MSKLENKHVFVIEDNPANYAIIATLLQMYGAKTGFERWGTTTIGRLRKFAPVDLILLDLMFPYGVSGFDIFDEIRACPEFAQVPIVAVSAMDAAVAIPKVRAKGFSGFIAKPISFTAFPDQISKVLNNEAVWQYEPSSI